MTELVWARLLGGPAGGKEQARPDLGPGTRLVVRHDGKGAPMKPVVYVVIEAMDATKLGRHLAVYSGFATDDDLTP